AMWGLGVSFLTWGGWGTSGGFTTMILGSCISILGILGRTGGGGGGGGTNLGLTGSTFLGTTGSVSSVSRWRLSRDFLAAALMTMKTKRTITLTMRETKTDGLLWLPESRTPKWAN